MAAGTATVRSSVAGEAIFVDGVDTGVQTPGTVRNLAPGRHLFEVRGPCRMGQADVIIPDGDKVVVNIDSGTTTGSLQVQPTPADAEVRLNGQPFPSGSSATPVPCGDHSLSLTLPGYMPAFLNIHVDGGQRLVLPVELERMGLGQLFLIVSPPDARVTLDGVEIPVGPRELPSGPHVVQVSAPGHIGAEQQFLVEDRARIDLRFDLAPDPLAGAGVLPPPEPRPERPPRQGPGWWTAPHIGGVASGALGLGLGVVSILELKQMGDMGDEYTRRAEKVNTVRDYSLVPPSYANSYREDELLPQRNKAVALTTLSSLLLATGITLTFAF
jgi:hypothetical protein